jgi:hypothetical protein
VTIGRLCGLSLSMDCEEGREVTFGLLVEGSEGGVKRH